MNMIEYASSYAKRGWVPLPVAYMGKNPTANEWQKRSLEDFRPEEFVGDCNIGVLLGEPSGGLVDIDLDCSEALVIASMFLPLTGAIFGRDGNPRSHWVYQVSDCGASKKFITNGDNATLLEYRATGGQTVFPPSVHKTGEQISFYRDMGLKRVSRDELLTSVSKLAAACLLARNWHQGKRHDTALALAGGLVNAGWPQDRIEHFIRAICLAAGDEEREDRVSGIQSTIEAKNLGRETTGFPKLAEYVGNDAVTRLKEWLGFAREINITPSITTGQIISPAMAAETDYRDVTNAERFTKQYSNLLKYNYRQRKWFIYDDKRWALDDSGEANRIAMKAVQQFAHAAIDNHNAKTVGKLLDAKSIDNMLRLAQSLTILEPDSLDAEPMLLACNNTALNLETGESIAFEPTLKISKLGGANYIADAECPKWHEFLSQIMANNQNLIGFLKRAVGYSLTGRTDEQCLFMMVGTGANGKSTFMNTISKLLGDYARQTPIDTLMVQRAGAATNDLARLDKCRLVIASEGEQSQKLAEAKIKAITGGDTIAARFLHQEYFEFKPQFKLWIATNEKPTITGTDNGIWRRIYVIPFNVTIPENQRDGDLSNKLQSELSGILNWALQGCLEWQGGGLKPPNEVQAATNEYRTDMDAVAQFIDDCCELESEGETASAKLYTCYIAWCQANGEKQLKKNAFGSQLKHKGLTSTKSGNTRLWRGISIFE